MRSKLGTPLSSQHTASPSMMLERERRRASRLHDQREPMCQVVAWAAVQTHAVAVLASDDAVAVMLDFMQPRLASGWGRGFGGQAGRECSLLGARDCRGSTRCFGEP